MVEVMVVVRLLIVTGGGVTIATIVVLLVIVVTYVETYAGGVNVELIKEVTVEVVVGAR